MFGRLSVANALISASESSDEIGVVLRMHLVTESFLEAFICSALDNANVFATESDDKVVLKLNYHSKLVLAQKLGLPLPAYKGLEKLNNLRNKLAHRIDHDLVTKPVIDSISSHVRNIITEPNITLEEERAEIYNTEGESTGIHSLSSNNTPNTIKLMILISSLIRRTTQITVGFS